MTELMAYGSKQALFLACLDDLESRVREGFRQAVAAHRGEPLEAMGAGFRELLADGVISGFWLQACAAARRNEIVAERCRSVVSGVLGEAEELTGAAPDDLAGFAARGALVVLLQALGVDLSAGSRAAIESLRP